MALGDIPRLLSMFNFDLWYFSWCTYKSLHVMHVHSYGHTFRHIWRHCSIVMCDVTSDKKWFLFPWMTLADIPEMLSIRVMDTLAIPKSVKKSRGFTKLRSQSQKIRFSVFYDVIWKYYTNVLNAMNFTWCHLCVNT